MTTGDSARRRWPGVLLLGALAAAVSYLLVQAILDNADDPAASGHALLLIGGLCAFSAAVGWLLRRLRR